jgi:hypothetical protein
MAAPLIDLGLNMLLMEMVWTYVQYGYGKDERRGVGRGSVGECGSKCPQQMNQDSGKVARPA